MENQGTRGHARLATSIIVVLIIGASIIGGGRLPADELTFAENECLGKSDNRDDVKQFEPEYWWHEHYDYEYFLK